MCFLCNLLETKFSKGMLKRNLSVGTVQNTDYLVKNDIIRQFNRDKRTYKRRLNKNMKLLSTGKITKEVYLERQKQNIKEHFTKSYLAGKLFSQSTELKLTDTERRFIVKQTTEEMKYMKKFADDILNGTGKMSYKRRMNMYAGGLDPMFEFGNIAYLPEDVMINWVLGRTDKHCLDCLSFAYGSPYKKKELPGVPRSGNSRCLDNCRCSLEYTIKGKPLNPYVSFITKNYNSSRHLIPTEEDVTKILKMTDDFYYTRMTAILTKDKQDMEMAKTLKDTLLGYIVYKDLSVSVPLPLASTIKEFRTFIKNDNFEIVDDYRTLRKGMLVSIFKGGKQIYGTVYDISDDKLVVSTLKNKKEIIDTNVTHIFKEVGDY